MWSLFHFLNRYLMEKDYCKLGDARLGMRNQIEYNILCYYS